jgi:hypothetical protein
MSMSTSVKITNNSGSEIVITSMGTVNDDASFVAPRLELRSPMAMISPLAWKRLLSDPP